MVFESKKPDEHPGATYEDLSDAIDRVARRSAMDYPDVDWEDVRQELILFVLEHGESIRLKEYGGNPVWLLGRVARSYCTKLRSQHMSLSPQYAYRPSDVRKILETALNPAERVDTFVPDDAKNPLAKTFAVFDLDGAGSSVKERDPFAFADAMEVASDVSAAYDRLNEEERRSLFKRYVLGVIPDNSSNDRKKLNDAVKKLTHKLNTYRGRGAYDRIMRKVKSNAGSRMAISENWDGK